MQLKSFTLHITHLRTIDFSWGFGASHLKLTRRSPRGKYILIKFKNFNNYSPIIDVLKHCIVVFNQNNAIHHETNEKDSQQYIHVDFSQRQFLPTGESSGAERVVSSP